MRRVEIEEFLGLLGEGWPGFDVRTPAEFEKGRIPGVRNLPLFSDEERAVVGTLYKQEGRQEAIKQGLEVVGPKMRGLVEVVEEVAGPPGQEGQEVLVHCWRGGMRSGSVGWLLELYGYEVVSLQGGYKAFRRWVLGQLEDPPPLVVLGGATGVGKTEILEALRELGEPVVDLEGLANHRGSAFGGLLLEEQPSQQHFENLLGMALRETRKAGRPVWVEDESRMIGRRQVPNPVRDAMRAAQVFVVEAPLEERLARLVEVYGEAPQEALVEAFRRIRKSLGGLRTQEAQKAVAAGDLRGAAQLALEYYDKAYAYGTSRRAPETVHPVEGAGPAREMARRLIRLSRELFHEELV